VNSLIPRLAGGRARFALRGLVVFLGGTLSLNATVAADVSSVWRSFAATGALIRIHYLVFRRPKLTRIADDLFDRLTLLAWLLLVADVVALVVVIVRNLA